MPTNVLKKKTRIKKLVTVSAISMPVIVIREETFGKNLGSNFAQVLCIQYPINFRQKYVLALFDLGSKINAIHPTFAKELGLVIRATKIRAQKINNIILDTFEILVAVFSVTDKAHRVKFFEQIFLVANVSPEVVLGMLFVILNSTNIDF